MLGGTLGPYRLDRELGAGGMGKVWAARVEGRAPGLDVGRVVALKVVHPHLLETPGFFKRFLREAEIGKAVVHENVVRTFDCDSLSADGKRADFLVMEYVEGQTLRSLLEELERVPEELCRHIGREVAKGLAAIHAAGVVHRDMKPENVIITADHAVKVMDLGVARLQDEAMRLSQTGAFVGSIHYAAPESFREGGKHVDGRADLHALGLVLYEMSSGVNPYVADDVPQILRKVLHEEPRRLGDMNPQLSPFFEEVVHTLLAKDPAARFADAAALVAVLEEGEKSAWWASRAKAIRAETKRPLRRIRIPRETAVYGREAELAKLHALFEKAKSTDGQVVLIEGEAGIGKSRLVDELVGRLQRDGEDLNFLFGSYPPGGAATAAGAFSTAFREQFGADGSAAYLTQSPVLVPAFDALLRGETTPTGVEALTKGSLQTCFVHAARGLAAERTTVLLIDDLHFATDDARSLFTSLAMAVPGHRILLVGTTRPGTDEKWLAGLTRLPQASRTAIGRLGPKDLALLLRDSFKSEELAQSLAMQIGLKSDGNPFFAFEIIRGLREGQFITQEDDGTWVSTGVVAEIRIPSSVLDLVNARVADLTTEERDLLDVAACCGFEFDPGVVAAACGLPPLAALKRFAAIEKQHRLVRAAGRRLVFDHHQVQEALYGSLYEQMREAYHAAIAGALETRAGAAEKKPEELDGALCVDLCEHLFNGAQHERALRYLEAARTHLERGSLHAQVAALTERALAVPGLLAGAVRAKLLLRHCDALGMLSRRAREEECTLEAGRLAEELDDDALRGRAANALGGILLRASRHEEAESACRRAIELARSCGDRPAESMGANSLAFVFQALGRFAEAAAQYEQSLALARECGYRAGEAGALVNLGLVLCDTGRFAEAKSLYEQGLAICREIGHRRFEAAATVNLGIAAEGLSRFDEALAWFEQGLALCRAIGHRHFEANATGSLGNTYYVMGRLADARAQYERHRALAQEIGDAHGAARAAGNLGMVFHSLGRFPEAQAHFERYLAFSREVGDRSSEATATGNLGNTFQSLGRFAEARACYERELALGREMDDRTAEARALETLGPAWLALGDAPRARAVLESALALYREMGARHGEADVLDNLGDVADAAGDAAGALRAAEESLVLHRASGGAAGIARSLLAIGDLRRRAGETDAARAALEEAVRLLREQGRNEPAALALARLACLPGGDAKAAERTLADVGDTAGVPEIRLLLWQATRDRAHLAEAKRRLDELLAKNPPEFHEAMRTNVRVNREIDAACKAERIG